MVLREVKKMTNRHKMGENSIFSPIFLIISTFNDFDLFFSLGIVPVFLCLYRRLKGSPI